MSGLESQIARDLTQLGVKFQYEKKVFTYDKPARQARYKPDFILDNGTIVEAKGYFPTADRQKHKLIKVQCPTLDIRFVFSNPNQRISKQSQTTYAMWCEQHGFKYAKGTVPKEWVNEKPH